jgi:GNAT superfamily N-acetyltransferase
MNILFLHGWTSVPGGRKPTFLKEQGHHVLNPPLPDDDFETSVRIAESLHTKHHPDVIVGSSRGGAIAMNMNSTQTPLVLLCPAWKNWGTATTVKSNCLLLHARDDEVIPFSDSEELAQCSHLPSSAIVEIGNDHRLADTPSLEALLKACEQLTLENQRVEVTVYYLEMHAPFHPMPPEPQASRTVLHIENPSVSYYRFLYNAVGQNYHWLSRRQLSDTALADVIQDPCNELYVLHVKGSPAGFAELDCHKPDDIELVQFGLIADFIGQGLGKWFLQWTLNHIGSYQPNRFWLHTCSLDHPAALPTYQKAGLVLFDKKNIRRQL